MASAIKCVSGSLLRVAEDDVVEFLGIDSGALDGRLASYGAEFLRGIVFDFAAVAAEGRARPADDCDVAWFQHWVLILWILLMIVPAEWFRVDLLV